MPLRKNQACSSPAERLDFLFALLTLKNEVPSQMGLASRYDDYVSFHFHAHHSMTMTSPGAAHRGPAFLPWHREYLRRFEIELQTINSSITIPYWDWTVDSTPKASLWDEAFMGGDGDPSHNDEVLSGRFGRTAGRWKLTLLDPRDPSQTIRRTLGRQSTKLPTGDQVKDALGVVPYYNYPWRAFSNLATPLLSAATRPSFCNRIEGNYGDDDSMHNQVHAWVGGTMASIMGSPNDPVFWLVHSNVDRLWAQWQVLHPEHSYRPSGTPGEMGPRGHNVNDPMHPWGGDSTPASVLIHFSLGYWYDTDPPEIQNMAEALGRLPAYPPTQPEDLVHR